MLLPMMKWVNALFAKKKLAPQPLPPQPQVTSAPVRPARAPAPAARDAGVSPPSDFVEAILKFGYDDFRTCEGRGDPHLLQSVTMTRHNYLHQYSGNDSNILRSVYAEGEGNSSSLRPHEWSQLKPKVSAFLAAQAPETAAAFETFLRYCRKYSRSVADTVPDGNGCRNITVAQHAFSNAEGAELTNALEKMWKVLPDTDPRVMEGMDYVMASQPVISEAFSGYGWTKNDSRSDFEIAGRIKSGWSSPPSLAPGRVALIAEQSAENIALLKPQAEEIAETILAWGLSRPLDIDLDWRLRDRSREAARSIFGTLDCGGTIADLAQAIQNGVYGAPRDKSDDGRQRSAKALAAAPELLALAQDVRSGAWFDAERLRLQELVGELRMTPGERAQRERARHDAEVDRIAADATVLENTVRIRRAFRLKPKSLASY
jgi:hypothetical protein